MAIIQQTSERQKLVDLTVGYAFDAFAMLIPVTNAITSNTAAVIKPFQLPVHISIKMNSWNRADLIAILNLNIVIFRRCGCFY